MPVVGSPYKQNLQDTTVHHLSFAQPVGIKNTVETGRKAIGDLGENGIIVGGSVVSPWKLEAAKPLIWIEHLVETMQWVEKLDPFSAPGPHHWGKDEFSSSEISSPSSDSLVHGLWCLRSWARITVLLCNSVKESINHEMWICWKQDSFIWELTKLLVPSPFHSPCLFNKLFHCRDIKFTFNAKLGGEKPLVWICKSDNGLWVSIQRHNMKGPTFRMWRYPAFFQFWAALACLVLDVRGKKRHL